jgi:hypothetical protein
MKQRPTTRLGLASDMRAPAYEQRATKPARNRIRLEPGKVKTTKPKPHQVGRTKR